MSAYPSHPSSIKNVRLCQSCELPVEIQAIKRGHSAYCPRCNTQLYRSESYSISGNLAIAVTGLLLFLPSLYFDFISIRLVGVMIPGTLIDGVKALYSEGYPGLAFLTFYCAMITPFVMCSAIVVVHLSLRYRWYHPLRYALNILGPMRHWVMLDVFLVSIAVSCFKLQDYSDIFVGNALYSLILLQVLSVMLLSRISIRRYWEEWQKEHDLNLKIKDVHCRNCHLSQPESSNCIRCHHALYHRKPFSVQKTWALVIAACVALLPANLIPISILLTNGQRLEDTIFSGVASLINSEMYGIAAIIFIASIVVPVAKVIGLIYLLLIIQFKKVNNHRYDMMIYRAIKWIGKWSMLDLFVISIMLTLVDRGQILNFTPGFGAVAFGIVVILTMLAAESIDPRLLWDSQPKSKQPLLNKES